MKLIEDAQGHPQNANLLCRAAQIAYLPGTEGGEAFQQEFGMSAKFYSVGNTQAYLAENNEHILLSFRGTEAPTSIEGLKDWLLTDAMNLLVVPEGRLGHDLAAAGVGAKFHKGFADAIADVWQPISQDLVTTFKRADRPVWISGHSLGGALALFAAWLSKRQFVPIHQIYTYGGPMIGNQRACDAFDREFSGRIHRYVHGHDPVPKLPALSLVANEFAHVKTERIVGSEPMTSIGDFLGTIGSRVVSGIFSASLVDEVWVYVKSQLASHFLDSYSEHLKKI
jgi:predicted lipase